MALTGRKVDDYNCADEEESYHTYVDIAARYEALGNEEEAIYNYTEAIGVWRVTAPVLFRRGRLYYRRKEWAKARIDLEKALEFLDEEGLPPAMREEAGHYLVALEESLDGS
jgi:tetratricopeptide (TPR) repeat protein